MTRAGYFQYSAINNCVVQYGYSKIKQGWERRERRKRDNPSPVSLLQFARLVYSINPKIEYFISL
jgi:hypothetical protein